MPIGLSVIYYLISFIPIISSILQVIPIVSDECDISNIYQIESFALLILTMILITSTCCILCIIDDLYDLFESKEDKSSMLSYTNLSSISILYFVQYIIVIHIYSTSSHQISCNTDIIIPDILEYLFLSWIIIYGVTFILILISITAKVSVSFTDRFAITICAANTQLLLTIIPSILQFILVTSNNCSPLIDVYFIESILNPIVIAMLFIMTVIMIGKSKMGLASCVVLLFFIHSGIVIHSCYVWMKEEINCGPFEAMKTVTLVFWMILSIQYSIVVIGGACWCILHAFTH